MAQKGQASMMLRVLRDRYRNLEVSNEDLQEATGLTRSQVQGAIGTLRRTCVIDTPRHGWYLYRGPKEAAAEKVVPLDAEARVTAILADGRVLVTIEGVLYIAHELVIDA